MFKLFVYRVNNNKISVTEHRAHCETDAYNLFDWFLTQSDVQMVTLM